MQIIDLIQKEALTIKFDVKKKLDGSTVDVAGATCTLMCKDSKDAAVSEFTINDSDFNKNVDGYNYRISTILNKEHLNWYGKKYGLLKIEVSSTDIYKYYFMFHLDRSSE